MFNIDCIGIDVKLWKKKLSEVESRTPGLRPTTQKKSKVKDSPFEDKPSRGQGHKRKCSKKKGLQKNFSAVLQ